jgi:geranylgeranyl diphosphate synthase type I
VLSDEMLHSAGLEPWQLDSARPLLNTMRTEVVIGQHLDLTATGQPPGRLDTALDIIKFKTARYTTQRPLQIGAALGGAAHQMLDGLASYARPAGEAFQLRDDLLGVFGDPGQTGKSDLEDLRDGKATVLMAHTLRSADGRQTRSLQALVGNPRLDHKGAHIVRDLLHDTGAVSRVEEMIAERARRARQARRSSSRSRGCGASREPASTPG